MSSRILFALGATVFLLTASLSAHHSFSAVYQTKEEVKLEGKLVQVSIRNPHSYIFIEAPDPEGKMQRWSLEWGGAAQLAGQGVNQQTLKIGDHVVITGRPSRTPGEYRVLVQTITSEKFSWGRGRGEVVD
jgi:lysyl-tRNA synthetase class II